MTLVDFVYCGDSLSNHSCMIASMITSNETSISNGSILTQNTVKNFASSQNSVLNTAYDLPVTATFDIFKNDCDTDDLIFSDIEISYFMRWLNQKVPQKFTPIYDDTSYMGLFFIGSFTDIKLIYVNSNVIGFTVTFTSDSPWGYTTEEYTYGNVSDFFVADLSDEIGFTYPIEFAFTVKQAGNLTIKNDMRTNYYTSVINNCMANETIKFDCKNKIVTTSVATHKIYNDFNFIYPCLVNSFTKKKNNFSLSLPCDVYIKVNPIRKVGFIV